MISRLEALMSRSIFLPHDERIIRSQALKMSRLIKELRFRHSRQIRAVIRPNCLHSAAGSSRPIPLDYVDARCYVHWVADAGFPEFYSEVDEREWVWRPLLNAWVTGEHRAKVGSNLLVFDLEAAHFLDELERNLVNRVKELGHPIGVELVVEHVPRLQIASGQLRWVEYGEKIKSRVVYRDIPT